MLILSRKQNDSLIIEVEGQSEVIEIKITELTNSQARLGIDAPEGCKIWRKELYQTIQNNRQAAADTPAAMSKIRNIALQLYEETSE